MQNIINLHNENKRLKAQNQSLQKENQILQEKLKKALEAFNAILKGSLPCNVICDLETKCYDEVTNYGDICMIRISQKAIKELEKNE